MRLRKSLFVLFSFTFIFLTEHVSKSYLKPSLPRNECIRDSILDSKLIREVNRFFSKDDRSFKILMISNSMMMDLGISVNLLVYIIWGVNSMIWPSVYTYGFIRLIALSIERWPFPSDYIFGDPGFPSFFVPYKATNDFYFSGHTATATILLFVSFFCFRSSVSQHSSSGSSYRQSYELRDLAQIRSERQRNENRDFSSQNENSLFMIEEMNAPIERPLIPDEHYNPSLFRTQNNQHFDPDSWALPILVSRLLYSLLFLSTISTLIITSGHYINDLIIGFVVGTVLICFYETHKFPVLYFFLKVYCIGMSKVVCSGLRKKRKSSRRRRRRG